MSSGEEWKSIAGTDEMYEVSDLGNVRSWWGRGQGANRRPSVPNAVKPLLQSNGYLKVWFSRKAPRRTEWLHQLVAEAFPQGVGSEVRHLDGNPLNNNATNLRWGSRLENAQDAVDHGTYAHGAKHGNAKLDDDKVTEMFKMRTDGLFYREIADLFGISPSTAQGILTGKHWKHHPLNCVSFATKDGGRKT